MVKKARSSSKVTFEFKDKDIIQGLKAGIISGAITGLIGGIISAALVTALVSSIFPIAAQFMMGNVWVSSIAGGLIGGAIIGAIIGILIVVLKDMLPGKDLFQKALVGSGILFLLWAIVGGLWNTTFLVIGVVLAIVQALIFGYCFNKFWKNPLF